MTGHPLFVGSHPIVSVGDSQIGVARSFIRHKIGLGAKFFCLMTMPLGCFSIIHEGNLTPKGTSPKSKSCVANALGFKGGGPVPEGDGEVGGPIRTGDLCGDKAANELDAFIGDCPITCIEVERDRYGGSVGVCTVDDIDLADRLVRNGLAFNARPYSRSAYAEAQREAEQNERGLWAGSFVMPWQFRACPRNRGRASKCSDD